MTIVSHEREPASSATSPATPRRFTSWSGPCAPRRRSSAVTSAKPSRGARPDEMLRLHCAAGSRSASTGSSTGRRSIDKLLMPGSSRARARLAAVAGPRAATDSDASELKTYLYSRPRASWEALPDPEDIVATRILGLPTA